MDERHKSQGARQVERGTWHCSLAEEGTVDGREGEPDSCGYHQEAGGNLRRSLGQKLRRERMEDYTLIIFDKLGVIDE